LPTAGSMRFGHENVTLRTLFSGTRVSVAVATVGTVGCVGVAGGKGVAGAHWVSNRFTTAKTVRAIIVLLFMFISLSSFERVEKVMCGGDFINFNQKHHH
jgi:ABC-type nitrate/sulfonate/bicarbonate transport system permease component